MTALRNYLEPIELAGKSLGDQYRGYRIDGNSPDPDMRRDAGLGTCNSCDYFISQPTALILIEETQLALQVRHLKREFHYLNEAQQTDFISKRIRNEMKLKVYGSMLVLCRLSSLQSEASDLVNRKKYSFWLVASGEANEEDMRVLDNLRDRLLDELGGALTREVLEDVRIFPSSAFVDKLSQMTD